MITYFGKYYLRVLNCFTSLFLFKYINANNRLTPTTFDLRKYLYLFVVFLFSLSVLYSFQKTDLSNPLLKAFDSFWLSFADKVTTWTYNFVSLIVKVILPGLPLVLSLPSWGKIMFFPLKF